MSAESPEPSGWPTAAEWLASGSPDAPLVVAGLPLAEGAVTADARYDLAPAAIRARLAKLSVFHGERAVLLPERVHDAGDALDPPPLPAGPGELTVLLGGHNGVTWSALRERDDLARWALLTFDAHHDVRPYRGVPGNGSPVRALVDAGLPGAHVVQIGIAGFSNAPAHRAWCESAGITVLGPERLVADEVERCLDVLAGLAEHVYVDIDVDVLDRAFAPGCPGARPGGVTPRALFDAAFVAGAHPAVRAVDIVEIDPSADVASVTVDAGALCLLNVSAGFATRS